MPNGNSWGVGTWAQTTEKVVFADQGYGNAKLVTSYKGKDFSIAFAKGSNSTYAPKYYTSDNTVRIYNSNTMTFNSSTGNIAKIVFTYKGSDKPTKDDSYTLSTGSYVQSKNTWTSADSKGVASVTFTNTEKTFKIKSIEVTFASTSSVATPTFSDDSKSFSDKFDLKLSAGSDAAMIMYTTDGSTPSYKNGVGELYETPISITHSTMVKAIAVSSKGEESNVVTKEYKLELPAPIISEATKIFIDPFTVSLSTKATAAEGILYTLDGTDPSLEKKPQKIYRTYPNLCYYYSESRIVCYEWYYL